MNNVEIIGTGSYAPSNIMKNSDLENIVNTSDEWISSRTGIKERRISVGENTSDLSIKASLKAIEDANISPEDIDLIIVATISPDNYLPSTACIVQGAIKACNATCFDISAACTGFIYGLSIAATFIKTGEAKVALVVGAEVLSKMVNWKDRNTCVLFGDGAGAAILRASEQEGIMSISTYSEGDKGEYLKSVGVPLNNPYVKDEKYSDSYVSMNGKEIFKFALRVLPQSINDVLKKASHSLEDIKYIVPHQANLRIIEAVAKKLNISEDKFYTNLKSFGNTSGASIPLALDEMARKGLIKRGDKIILSGFGGGLTYGATILKWTK